MDRLALRRDRESFWTSAEVDIGTMIYISEKLFEWHFDVFNLIEQNLAITKTINKNSN